MGKRIILLLTLLVSYIQNFAQVDALMFMPNYKGEVYLTGQANANSNSVSGKLMLSYLRGGFIDNETKNTTLDRLKTNNRLGLITDARVGGVFRLDSLGKWYMRTELGNRLAFASTFAPDAFKLIFYGNAQFAGTTANLNNLNINFFSYNNLSFSLINRNEKRIWEFGLGAVQGVSHLGLNATDASLFTSTNFDTLKLNGTVDVNQSGRGRFANGVGAALRLSYTKKINPTTYIAFGIDNIGILAWNNTATSFSRTGETRFSGIDISTVLQGDTAAFENIIDSLGNAILPTEQRGSYTTLLPFNVNASFSHSYSKIILIGGLRYTYLPGFIPLVNVGAVYLIPIKTKALLMPSLELKYGGFGGFNTAISLAYQAKGWVFMASTINNEGYFIPANASGIGAMLTIRKWFGK